MIPPEWARKNSRRLNLEEFQSQFSYAWSKLAARFLKLECWQSYQELEASESQDAYNRGDVVASRDLLREEAEADRPLYEDIRERGLDYSRIRLVQEPLTSYLAYELTAYQIRASMGENIEVVRFDAATQLPSEECFDFLLFDRHTALIHDYGMGNVGRQTGGWVTHDADIIASLGDKANAFRHAAAPLLHFLADLQR
jgi:hypothetical protein